MIGLTPAVVVAHYLDPVAEDKGERCAETISIIKRKKKKGKTSAGNAKSQTELLMSFQTIIA